MKGGRKGKGSQGRVFDFLSTPGAHVALRLAYQAGGYWSFAVQGECRQHGWRPGCSSSEDQAHTGRQSSNYHRCGRTDKGTAFSQVISIDLAPPLSLVGGWVLPSQLRLKGKENQMPQSFLYAKMLNRVLPQDIRVLDWSAVEMGFSARFDCQSRTYRYYFPTETWMWS
ncbi:hypothetical protein AAFF_G00089690 [Aldrovandia affinis]|uniref:Uncharacterized protein n=1 Tax=Aldrovandia affinis TaxID=143900 RepID=A0AAD7R1J8_9TELE|nr:hypothetical protein AAFF_G00089690 [Aldrovandia affinis]